MEESSISLRHFSCDRRAVYVITWRERILPGKGSILTAKCGSVTKVDQESSDVGAAAEWWMKFH